MKSNKWIGIVVALVYIALGILFIVRPIKVGSALCYMLAAAVAVLGLIYMAGFFLQRAGTHGERDGNGFAVGLLLIIMAVFIVAKQELVISLVPFLFGVMILIRGLIGVQNTFIMHKLGFGAKGSFLSGLVTMGLGLFIMLFPFKTAHALFILIGIGLVVGGLAGIAGDIMIQYAIRRQEHEAERARDTAQAKTTEYTVVDAEAAAEEGTAGASGAPSGAAEDVPDAGQEADAAPSDADPQIPV